MEASGAAGEGSSASVAVRLPLPLSALVKCVRVISLIFSFSFSICWLKARVIYVRCDVLRGRLGVGHELVIYNF